MYRTICAMCLNRSLLTPSDGNFLDLYLNGKVSLTAYFSVRSGTLHNISGDYAITFEVVPSANCFVVNNGGRGCHLDLARTNLDRGAYNVQSTMPVKIGARINDSKNSADLAFFRVGRSFTSLARLYQLKPVSQSLGKPYLSEGCSIRILSEDGEVELGFLGLRVDEAEMLIRDKHGRIKSRSQLVEVLTQFKRQHISHVDNRQEFEKALPIIPQIGNDCVGFIVKKSLGCLYERFSVRLSPINPFPTLLE